MYFFKIFTADIKCYYLLLVTRIQYHPVSMARCISYIWSAIMNSLLLDNVMVIFSLCFCFTFLKMFRQLVFCRFLVACTLPVICSSVSISTLHLLHNGELVILNLHKYCSIMIRPILALGMNVWVCLSMLSSISRSLGSGWMTKKKKKSFCQRVFSLNIAMHL